MSETCHQPKRSNADLNLGLKHGKAPNVTFNQGLLSGYSPRRAKRYRSKSVTAPTLLDETSLAYFASTPVV